MNLKRLFSKSESDLYLNIFHFEMFPNPLEM